MCSAEAAIFDCDSGTIFGRDVVPDVCRNSAMSSASGLAASAGISTSDSDRNVKLPAGASWSAASRRILSFLFYFRFQIYL